jgi:hypothetical protein
MEACDELIPLEQAATRLGIEPKRLLGYALRNRVGDPIGGLVDGKPYLYDWSLATLRAKLQRSAPHSAGAIASLKGELTR